MVDSKYVSKAFQVKFGNLYIVPEHKPHSKIDVKELIEQIEGCLKPLSNIEKIETIEISAIKLILQGLAKITPNGPEAQSLILTHPFKIDISLPIKNQEETLFELELYNDRVDCTTKFGILYNASIYMYYREINLSKNRHPGYIDIRELFSNVIKDMKGFREKQTWKILSTYPNPLRQDFIFLFLQEKPETQEYLSKKYLLDNSNLYLFLPEQQLKKLDEFLATILYKMSIALDIYYNGIFQLEEIKETVGKLDEIHKSIQAIIDNSLNLSFFNVKDYYKNSRKLEKSISSHFSILFNYSSKVHSFKKDVGYIKEYINGEALLSSFQEVLLKELELEEIDAETLTSCINFAREIMQRSYTTKVTLLGTLIGIIGTILGTSILNFLGL